MSPPLESSSDGLLLGRERSARGVLQIRFPYEVRIWHAMRESSAD